MPAAAPMAEVAIIPEYLTAAQVSRLTGFSIKSLDALRHKRKGPPYLRIGNRVRYRRADVLAWLDAHQVA